MPDQPPADPESQSTPAPLITRLGLPPQITQNRDLPTGIDGTAIISALEAAIADLVPLLGLSPLRDLLPGQVLRIVVAAARSLLADPKLLREAVYLTEQAREDLTDNVFMAHIRILALAQLAEHSRLIAEINRLLALEPPDPQLRGILHDFVKKRNLFGAIEQRAQNHVWLWGEIPSNLTDRMKSLDPSEMPVKIAPRQIDFLCRLRKDRDLSHAEFTRRLLWGVAVFRYTAFISHCSTKIDAARDRGEAMSNDEVQVFALFNQIDSVIHPPDLSPLERARDEGRSIVIVEAHAGTSLLSNLGLPALGMPLSIVSASAKQSADPRNFNIATSGNYVQADFLKLVKLFKKEKRLVRLSPDGPAGDSLEFDLFDRTIALGQGAATLAFHGRAATFFCTSRWDGIHFQLGFKPGPVAGDFQQREDFERAFYDFYLGCLKDIVLGAPEDMAINGGFWRFLQ